MLINTARRNSKRLNKLLQIFQENRIAHGFLIKNTTISNNKNNFVNKRFLHISQSTFGLEEFFDSEKNWGEQEVKVGRSWRKEELRLKSNEDLHKLWYVLLKERNMLFTMEKAAKDEFKLFPNPERIDKVEESMNNLEIVIKERNKAYWLLETGEIGGERPSGTIIDSLGRHIFRQFKEFPFPDYLNTKIKNHPFLRNPIPNQFFRLLREKEKNLKKYKKRKAENYIAKLFSLYPDIDIEALQKKFPDHDVHEIRTKEISRGNHENNQS